MESTQVGDSVSCLAVAPERGFAAGRRERIPYTVQSSSLQVVSGSLASKRALGPTDAQGEMQAPECLTKTLKRGATTRAAGISKGVLRGSGGLVLSSGVDWTVKLWAPAYSDAPLLSLVSHSYDYMSDVKWNPSHPSLFATASSNGTVGLWNLATSFEDPLTGTDGIVVEPDAMSGRGLNKLKWSSDGRRMAVASADRLHVLSLSEEVVRQKGDEDSKVMNQLMARGLVTRQ
jgi:dynein intermediate chain